MDIPTILIVIGVCFTLLLVIGFALYFNLKSYKGHNRFVLFLRYKVFKIKNNSYNNDSYYSLKPRFLSPNEQKYFVILKNLLKDRYYVFPQVPLSQLVEKHSKSNFKNELFRVIDFCVFDKDYYPLLCIEINDNSHLKKERTDRDKKVADILKSARLPLLTLWTYEGINESEIKRQLKSFHLL